MGIAVIMDVGAGAIEERGTQRIDTLAASNDGRLLAAGKLAKRAQRDLDRSGAAARQRHREEIHQGAFCLMPHGGGDILPSRPDHMAGEPLRHAR
jgi:hypothetical protein